MVMKITLFPASCVCFTELVQKIFKHSNMQHTSLTTDEELNILTGMLTMLVKTVVNTIIWQQVLTIPIPILLLESIAISQKYQYQYFCDNIFCFAVQRHSFFPRSSINKVNSITVVKKMAKLP